MSLSVRARWTVVVVILLASALLVVGSPQRASAHAASLTDCPLLAMGSTGDCVLQLQQALNKVGANPPLAEDTKFGPATQKAVVAFQLSHKLQNDGIAGPATLAALSDAVKNSGCHYPSLVLYTVIGKHMAEIDYNFTACDGNASTYSATVDEHENSVASTFGYSFSSTATLRQVDGARGMFELKIVGKSCFPKVMWPCKGSGTVRLPLWVNGDGTLSYTLVNSIVHDGGSMLFDIMDTP